MAPRTATVQIRFDATLDAAGDAAIFRLPPQASAKLPSRGQVAVVGTLAGRAFRAVLEPDGDRGHWLKVDGTMQKTAGLVPGATATIDLAPTKDWPEPGVPKDLTAALSGAPPALQRLWAEITPMARWEWVRWVNATKNPATRERRVEVALSKLADGKRRPCCFDLAACTDPDLTKNGKLWIP